MKKHNLGLMSWKNAPNGKIMKSDSIIAKNYLKKEELGELNRVVNMYLDFAEDQARRNIPITMKNWSEKLNAFLTFTGRELLENPGKVTSEIAKKFAECQFEEYRITQDKSFESDFDRFSKEILNNNEK